MLSEARLALAHTVDANALALGVSNSPHRSRTSAVREASPDLFFFSVFMSEERGDTPKLSGVDITGQSCSPEAGGHGSGAGDGAINIHSVYCSLHLPRFQQMVLFIRRLFVFNCLGFNEAKLRTAPVYL